MAEIDRKRMEFLLDGATDRRLERLAAKLELPRSAVVRMAIRQMAEREGVEDQEEKAAA